MKTFTGMIWLFDSAQPLMGRGVAAFHWSGTTEKSVRVVRGCTIGVTRNNATDAYTAHVQPERGMRRNRYIRTRLYDFEWWK